MASAVETYKQRSWWQRMKARMSGSMHPVGTIAAPMGQHYEMTAEQKYKAEHGFSAATTPAPWSDDIRAHNKEIDREYAEEIEYRKKAFLEGKYQPRFIQVPGFEASTEAWAHYEAVVQKREPILADDINWDLEMSMDHSRRVDITNDDSIKQPSLTVTEAFEARLAGNMGREVANLERGGSPVAQSPRDVIGSRARILAECGGSEELADQVEQKAREFFEVEDLDAPMPQPEPRNA